MTEISLISAQQIREVYDEILPHSDDKIVMCCQLLRSISYCEDTGSGAWSVSILDRGFRLNVGQVEALTCFYTFGNRKEFATPREVGLLDLRFLISGPDAQQLVERVAPDLVKSMNYRSVNEPHWAVTTTLLVEGESSDNEREETLELIRAAQSAHRHFVVRAAHTPAGALRKRSNFARYNCAALVSYARQETEAMLTPAPCAAKISPS